MQVKIREYNIFLTENSQASCPTNRHYVVSSKDGKGEAVETIHALLENGTYVTIERRFKLSE